MLAGCKDPQSAITCDVDPDAVFGQHYTAADFQIWKMVSGADIDQLIFDSDLPDSLFYEDDMFNDILVKECDTAMVAAALCPLCCQRGWYQLWGPWNYDDKPTDYQVLYLLIGKPLFDSMAVTEAKVNTLWETPVVVFKLDEKYHADWHRITRDNIGRRISIKLGNRVLTAPMVNGEITGGACSVSGLSEDECCALASILLRKN